MQSPKSLVELTMRVVDSEPLPECMYWSAEQVIDWIENTVRLPQYMICFNVNYIKGRHLILLGPSKLVEMGIHQWDHIKLIMNAIRSLYRVPMPRYARDLTLPLIHGTAYDWYTLYYRYIANKSPELATPRSEYWRTIGLLQRDLQPEYFCHWYSISADKEENKVRIGRYRKKESEYYWVPMFREGNYVPTQQKLEYFFMDPLNW